MMLKKNKNLIICLTPLQMLIADTILQKKINSNDEYIFICICYHYNEKFNTYFNRVSNKASSNFLYQVLSKNKLGRFIDLLSFNKKIINQLDNNFNNIYFASIDNPFVQLTLSKIKYNKMISFDDGTANLWPSSVYNKPIDRGGVQKIISKLVGIRLDEELIKSKISKHYTIFSDSVYLKSKSEFLPLFNFCNEKQKNVKVIKLFLGQPLSAYKFSFFKKENVVKILKNLEIDFYFPHPQETDFGLFLETIQTKKIFEDYVLELLMEGYIVEVYTFFSSAALTVSNLDNVNVFAVVDMETKSFFLELYKIFEKNNVVLIKLDEGQ